MGRKRTVRFGWKADVGAVLFDGYAQPMIWNIIDRRERQYRWREVNAIVEAVEADNSCQDADQAPSSDVGTIVDYDALEAVSVREAVQWANEQPCPVTLYLYDAGRGFEAEEHFHAVGNRFDDDAN